MAFDVEGYRKAAKEAGFSDAEIQKDIDEETQGMAAKGADADMANVKVGKDFMGIPEWLQPAAALAGGVALGGLGLKGAQKIKERMSTPQQPTARVEPSFGIPDIEPSVQSKNTFTTPQGDVTDVASRPVGADRLQLAGPAPDAGAPTAVIQPVAPTTPTAPVAPPAATSEPAAPAPLTDKQRLEKAKADLAEFKLQQAKDAATSTQKQQGKPLSDADSNLLKQSNKNTMDKANAAAAEAAAKLKAVPPVPTAPTTPVVETPTAAPVTAALGAAAVPPTPTSEAPTQTATEETKKPAKSKAIPTFKTESDIPKGMVFRPDVGNLDRSLVNILGTEGRLHAKDVLNEGQMFGNYKGGDYNKKVSDLVSAYGEELKKITPSIDLTTRDGRVAAGLPHTQNFGPALGKAVKVGGVLGTLMTVAQSANAKEALGNVAESLLPIGLTPSSLASGELTPEIRAAQDRQMKEMQKLGSPYRSVPPPKR
jgi:hypothetical protein